MIGTTVTIIGNVAADPEFVNTPTGIGRCTFRVAVTSRVKKAGEWTDGNTSWYRCTAWRSLADNCYESLHKGTRVVVVGQLENREFTDKNDVKRTSLEIECDDVGPSLFYATARINKAERIKAGVTSTDAFNSEPSPWDNDIAGGVPF